MINVWHLIVDSLNIYTKNTCSNYALRTRIIYKDIDLNNKDEVIIYY